MAVKGTNARILVDEFDLSCETATVQMSNAISEEDVTTLCSTAAEYTPILASMSINEDGYMSSTVVPGSFEKVLYDRMGVEGSYVAALFGTDNPVCPAYILENTFGATMEIGAPALSVITLNGTWGQGKGGRRGNVIAGLPAGVTITATGNQTPVDFGLPAGVNGGEAYLFVQAVTGTLTSASFIVQHCATVGGTYTTLGTFTVPAPGLGKYKVSFAGAVNQFIRLNAASMGGATGIKVVCIVCVKGVTGS